MSLIKCPECGQQVSSKAPICPHCGVPIQNNVKRCPVCNAYVLMNADECPQCNAKFVKEPTEIAGQARDEGVQRVQERSRLGGRDEGEQGVQSSMVNVQSSVAPAPKVGLLSPEENTAETSPKKPKSHTPWYLLVLLILALAIGGFFYWENQNQQQTEERAYALLVDCKDPLNFEDFIAQFPNSKHIDDVRKRLKELQMAKDEWEAALATGNVQKLHDFIKTHPDSPFRKQALSRIDSLDWLEANTKGTSVAYQYYIDQHETGAHIDQAYVAKEEAEKREQQAKADSIAAARAKAALADSLAAAAAATPAGIDVLTE